ncbi:MAG: DNA mismatch repair endonuclease MutL [Armatimonadaceae bacterium]
MGVVLPHNTTQTSAPSPEFGESVPTVVRLLDENTANRIAAGEVIERPSSVVKELVENALDAGATRIEVELEDGGKQGIIVRDNGCGMGREDAVLALQRHATSKIQSADDLFSIRTLGFRGEALPSIASVSDFRLLTKRREDSAATEVIVRGGDVVSVNDAGAPNGTTIQVENLFFNTPARLKFLKTTQTELNHAVELIQRLILAYHTVSFRLLHNGHEMLQYAGSPDPRHALAAVWGRNAAREMVPLGYESPALSVRGFVSKPSLSRASRSSQITFVNGRYVRSRTITHAFDAAFSRLMTTDRFPVMALFLEIAPGLVDVNVHPTKIEVRFTRDGDVYSAVHRAVEKALLTGGLVPEVAVQTSLPEPSANRENERTPTLWGTSAAPVTGNLPPKTALSTFGAGSVDLPDAPPVFPTTHLPALEADFPPASSPDAADSVATNAPAAVGETASYIGFDGYRIGKLRVLGQSRNTYIVAETEDAVLFIDQHVAHERVLYEQMMNGATEAASRWGVVAQHLALPQTLEFGAREARVVQERCEALGKAGFLLEPFGGTTFVVRSVPAAIAQKDYLRVLREIIEEITETSTARRLLVPHEAALIMASCKMAVKKGDPLTFDEMTRLLSDLARMKNPFTCPHGRPILLALPHREMDRKFHRIGPH